MDVLAPIAALALGLTAWACAYVSCAVGFFSTALLLSAFDSAQATLTGRHRFASGPPLLSLVGAYGGGALGGVLLPAGAAALLLGPDYAVLAGGTAVVTLSAVLWRRRR